MELAAGKCFDWIINNYSNKKKEFVVFCGIGNNGGDGLVIARKLINANYKVKTYIVNFSKKKSDDFKINLDRLNQINNSIELIDSDNFPKISKEKVIIDAIFGIGLTRSPTGFVKEIIQKINKSKATIISIDFPSGLFSELSVTDKDSVIRSNQTLTFQNPKLAFFLAENRSYSAKWHLIDIGLDQSFIQTLNTNFETIDVELIKSFYKRRDVFSHKGSFGHSLIIGGSFGKIGAVVLASKAALKIGGGLVTAYLPKCGYSIIQTSNPEVMVEVDNENYLQYFNFKTKPTVIGIGIGLGTHLKTINGFKKFLNENKTDLVIDADALNILAMHKELLQLIPENTVLTPHPKEFKRLIGEWDNDYDKIKKQLDFSAKYNCILVLKGAYTSIAYNGKTYFNTSGNPALATAGSGDVLTGIISGLIAQGYSSIEASILGVYLHGRTADFAIKKDQSLETFIASDSFIYFGDVFKEISL
jgi:hydroxyethylthiazole kinase-like uncharacterized protein yjeF